VADILIVFDLQHLKQIIWPSYLVFWPQLLTSLTLSV